MYINLGLIPKVNQLYPWSHWITPVFEKHRYNTLFFLSVLNSSQIALHDAKETTMINWFSPEEALAEHEKGSIFLPPPTWYIINELLRYSTVNDLINAGEARKFGTIIKPIMPIFQTDGNHIQLPKGRQFVSIVSLPAATMVADIAEGKSPQDKQLVITADEKNPTQNTWKYSLLDKSPHNTSKL